MKAARYLTTLGYEGNNHVDDLGELRQPTIETSRALPVENASPHAMVGCVDTASDAECTGWAWLPADANRVVSVEILIDGEKVAKINADRPRGDLAAAGFGQGKHGFTVDLRRHTIGRTTVELRVINSDTGDDLRGSPRLIRCPAKPFDRLLVPDRLAHSEPFDRFSDAQPLSYAELLRRVSLAKQQGTPIYVHAPLIDWNTPLFQRPQQMASALAKRGAFVIYCSPGSRYDVFQGTWQLAPNLVVTDQFEAISETFEGCWFDFYSTSAWAVAHMRSVGMRNRVIYQYVDHIDALISGPGTEQLKATFDALSTAFVTLFLATSRKLEAELVSRFGRLRVLCNPNGTEVEHFRSGIEHRVTVPDMERINEGGTKPIIGYFGAVAPWIDYHVVEEVARLMPDCAFVYIGPIYDDQILLPQASNLHWLGPVPYALLPLYGRYFDVAIIPFIPGPIAQTTSPLKLFEYFALECPVVVQADMEECSAFDFVRVASTPAEYEIEIRQALTKGRDEAQRHRIREAAEANTWTVRAGELIKAMKDLEPVGLPPRGIRRTAAVSLDTGNLEVRRRTPGAALHRSINAIEFYLDEGTPRRGDYAAVVLRPDMLVAGGHLVWHIMIDALDNPLLRERKPFAIQLIINDTVIMDDHLGAMPTELEFGFTTCAADVVTMRLLTLVDLNDAWNWGEAGRVSVLRLEVMPVARAVEGMAYVSWLSARRFAGRRVSPEPTQRPNGILRNKRRRDAVQGTR